jgi:ABC-2 type transport system ATP-binding protein
MIQCTHLAKNYGNLRAVDDVTLRVEEGEFCALLGPNGAGKTTIIKVLLDFVKPTSGQALLCRVPSREPSARANIGYLAENLRIPAHMSARTYLRRHAALSGMDGARAESRIDEVVELVGMKGKDRSRAKTFSKGMAQRIGLAAALVHKPRVLILDEPVTGLDPIGIREVRLVLEKLKLEKVTVLLSSHLLSEVEKLCSTAALINKGKLVLKDTVENLVKTGESLEDVFVRMVTHENT